MTVSKAIKPVISIIEGLIISIESKLDKGDVATLDIEELSELIGYDIHGSDEDGIQLVSDLFGDDELSNLTTELVITCNNKIYIQTEDLTDALFSDHVYDMSLNVIDDIMTILKDIEKKLIKEIENK